MQSNTKPPDICLIGYQAAFSNLLGQGGSERNNGHTYFTLDELLRMVWLCENVDGAIPVYEELSAKAQRIVRLQGIYRDAIPPEKEVALL